MIIRDGNVNQYLLLIGKKLPESNIDFEIESDDELESTRNPLSAHSHACNESLDVENDNLPVLATDQDKDTRHVFLTKNVKNWHFQKYFSKGSFAIRFQANIIICQIL